MGFLGNLEKNEEKGNVNDDFSVVNYETILFPNSRKAMERIWKENLPKKSQRKKNTKDKNPKKTKKTRNFFGGGGGKLFSVAVEGYETFFACKLRGVKLFSHGIYRVLTEVLKVLKRSYFSEGLKKEVLFGKKS